MRLGTSVKLFLAILAACAVVLTANGIASRLSFERDFMGYLNDQGVQRMREVLPRLQAAYLQHGGWDFLLADPDEWFALMRPQLPRSDVPFTAPPVSDQTGAVPRLALFDAQGRRLIGNPNAGNRAIRQPIIVDGREVGWLAMVPFQQAIDAGDLRFYEAQLRAWWVNSAASVVVATVLAWLLSRALLARLRGLTGSIHRLAAGDYAHCAAAVGNDEFGRLTADVNRLADTLENTERNRNAFMADISHELRTPLAVLRAELEAIEDGIRPLTAASLEPLQLQVRQLGKLIDDLHDLSVTQTGEMSYRFASIDLDGLLQTALAAVRGRLADAKLSLRTEPTGEALLVRGDELRLQQLFANLLENTLRYTHPGGCVAARTQRHGDQVEAVIEGSAPGVEPACLERLFERFYRTEGSRNRASGGSGLGLAICRNIVKAHGGTIRAEPSPLGGLRITVSLPRMA